MNRVFGVLAFFELLKRLLPLMLVEQAEVLALLHRFMPSKLRIWVAESVDEAEHIVIGNGLSAQSDRRMLLEMFGRLTRRAA